ncbi:MAG: hypothetical protein JXX28_06770 [Deltaproteobacteria bacterium]|nr:hypothetical protein [Deltaproteobacteria bacterium]
MWVFLPVLLGCSEPISLPSTTPAPETVAVGEKLEVREKRPLWQSKEPGPPPPEVALSAGQCNDFVDGGPVKGPDCVTDQIACGQTVIGHTRGGVDRFDTHFWEKKQCWPGTVNHNTGDERVYRLNLPDGKIMATATLDTPCADLDLMGFRWTGDTCPTVEHAVNQCESMRKPGKTREKIHMVSDRASQWFLVVEGADDQEGAFAITVQCGPWY